MGYPKLILTKWIKLGMVSIVLVACGAPKSTVEPATHVAERPSWVMNRPTDVGYYIGIAVASKTSNPNTYALEAQNNALNSLASEIEVRVKSNSMLFSFENNQQNTDEYKEFIQVKANQKISNYEQVAIWENANEYWVYYRLSKAQYQQDREADIQRAVSLSVEQARLANTQKEEGNILAAMRSCYHALTPIKPYLDESLPTEINGDQVFLGSYLFTQLSAFAHQFEVEALHPEVTTYWGATLPADQVTFAIVSDQGAKVSQVPVKFVYSEGVIRPRDGVTSAKGMVSTKVDKVLRKEGVQQVSCSIDFEKMLLNGGTPDDIDKLVFGKLFVPSAVTRLQVQSPTVYVSCTTTAHSKKAEAVIRNTHSALEVQGFAIATSKSAANLWIEVELSDKYVGKQYDLDNTLVDGTFKAYFKGGSKLIFSENYRQVRGVSAYKQESKDVAYVKTITEIRDKTVPRLYRKYMR